MKLGKRLIITGLLFSSILGSVNVGSITAMATAVADGSGNNNPAGGSETSSVTKKITIKFMNNKTKEEVKKIDLDIKKGKLNIASTDTELESKLPKGFKLVQKNIALPENDGSIEVFVESIPSRGGHSGYTSQRVRISFIDQDGNEVGFQQLKGKVSSDKKISAPDGYSFVNANEATIKFDKSSNKDIKLNVTKNKPVSTMEEGIVTTNSGDFKHLYTIEGKDITNRGLSGDSKWYTDQYATINGEKMFRVATNEWVKATDVYK